VNRALLWSAQNMGASRADDPAPRGDPRDRAVHLRRLPRRRSGGDDRVVITEMVSSADGLGYRVIYAMASLRTDRMLAVVVVIAALATCSTKRSCSRETG
jgi:hypothetical protein